MHGDSVVAGTAGGCHWHIQSCCTRAGNVKTSHRTVPVKEHRGHHVISKAKVWCACPKHDFVYRLFRVRDHLAHCSDWPKVLVPTLRHLSPPLLEHRHGYSRPLVYVIARGS